MSSNGLTSLGTAGRYFPHPGSVSAPEATSFSAVGQSICAVDDGGRGDLEAIASLGGISGHDLGLAVASEVMAWRLAPGGFGEVWVDADGELTGYYNGRPFSPYPDRNALSAVWDRIARLNLTAVYLRFLSRLIEDRQDDGLADPWAMHCCDPDLACRAALLAVRITS